MALDGHRGRIEALVLVGIGGFAGANGRFLVGEVVSGPLGTLLVNVVGSVLLGFLLYQSIFVGRLSRQTRLVVGTGVLSSFTTYSTFAVQSIELGAVDGLGYVLGTYALGIAGVVLGREAATRIGDQGTGIFEGDRQ